MQVWYRYLQMRNVEHGDSISKDIEMGPIYILWLAVTGWSIVIFALRVICE